MMKKHLVELKDTIEYKKYNNALFAIFIVAVIYFIVVLTIFIYMFVKVPFSYAILFILVSILVWSPLIIVLIYYLIKFFKRIRYLKKHYIEYIEFTIDLSTPINVGMNKQKYHINFNLNGKIIDIVSDIYSSNLITSNRIVVGFDEKNNNLIFIKCI